MIDFEAIEKLRGLSIRNTNGGDRTKAINSAMCAGYEAMQEYGKTAKATSRDMAVMRYITENKDALIMGTEANVKSALKAAVRSLYVQGV